jgi:MFS family permease
MEMNNDAAKVQNKDFLKLFIPKHVFQGAAGAILGIFVPIFLYETSGQVFHIVGMYFALLSLLFVFLVLPGMKLVNKIGFSRSLVFGGIISMIIYTIMFFLQPTNFWYLITPLAFAVVSFKIFHWIPYHVDFTLFTKEGERGSRVSFTFAITAILGVLGPIIAGVLIVRFGYHALFASAILLMVFATVLYWYVPETSTRFEWGVRETWKKFFSKDTRGMVLGEFADGAETMVSSIVWPIFLFEVLQGDIFEIGAVSSVVVGVTILIQIFVGKYIDTDKHSKEKTLKIGSGLYALGWIFKIFVLSAAHVFFVGIYHNIVSIFTKTPFRAIVYDMSADQGKYVDEYTVLREISTNLGRIFCLTVVSILSLFTPIGWTFLIAAVASIALNSVYRFKQT